MSFNFFYPIHVLAYLCIYGILHLSSYLMHNCTVQQPCTSDIFLALSPPHLCANYMSLNSNFLMH